MTGGSQGFSRRPRPVAGRGQDPRRVEGAGGSGGGWRGAPEGRCLSGSVPHVGTRTPSRSAAPGLEGQRGRGWTRCRRVFLSSPRPAAAQGLGRGLPRAGPAASWAGRGGTARGSGCSPRSLNPSRGTSSYPGAWTVPSRGTHRKQRLRAQLGSSVPCQGLQNAPGLLQRASVLLSDPHPTASGTSTRGTPLLLPNKAGKPPISKLDALLHRRTRPVALRFCRSQRRAVFATQALPQQQSQEVRLPATLLEGCAASQT